MQQKNHKIQQFIKRANETHNNKYDYSLWVSYGGTGKDYHTKNIPVVCPIHGKFLTSVANHLRGAGCPECAKTKPKNKKRLKYFIDKANKVHNNVYDYSLWVDVNNTSTDTVIIICKKHGKFNQTPANHIDKKAGCPKCAIEKRQTTCLQKYGTKFSAQKHISQEVLTNIEDCDWLKKQHEILLKSVPQIAKELGVSDSMVTTYMKKHNISVKRLKTSTGENQLISFLKTLNVKISTHNRSILDGQEIDIYLPEYNIAIEYNGLYWHSELHKHANYHLDKTEKCEQKGIRLIHIFEDEWQQTPQKCKDTIRHLLGKSEKGTYARNTYIKEIPWKQAKDFLNKYHLLNAGTCGNYRIGAFDKNTDDLIGVMVFGQQNNERSNGIELRRFVTNKKNNPGLGSKMFNFAITQNNYKEIIAFVDRRWFTGLVKDHIGFEKIDVTIPAIWWTNGKERFHRRFITKKRINQILSEENLTKREALYRLGYYRIYDCGKIKLKWSRKY